MNAKINTCNCSTFIFFIVLDDECALDFSCASGICSSSCESTGLCEHNKICSGDKCHFKCMLSADCASHQQCILGICTVVVTVS